mgnify:CR=1 FL=1
MIGSLVQELSDKILESLNEELLGLYIFGSLIMGDFEPDRSDLDLLTIVEHDINEQRLDNLRKMHTEFIEKYPQWDHRIEVAYVPLEGMKTFKTQTCKIVRISPGEPIHFRDMDVDWLMVWCMVQEHGTVLFGPRPDVFIPHITQQEFIDSLKNYLPEWLEAGKRDDRLAYQSYIILSLCRSMYVFAHGEQRSKVKAANWAKERYPQWSQLIDNALHWKDSQDLSRSPSAQILTEQFINFVLSEAEPGI